MDFPSVPIDLALLETPVEREIVNLEEPKAPTIVEGIVEPKSVGDVGKTALYIGAGLLGLLLLGMLLRSSSKS